jgi:hypothetical protein
VFNASPQPSVARIAQGDEPARGHVVDLLGNVGAPFAGQLAMGAWKIVTVQLTA